MYIGLRDHNVVTKVDAIATAVHLSHDACLEDNGAGGAGGAGGAATFGALGGVGGAGGAGGGGGGSRFQRGGTFIASARTLPCRRTAMRTCWSSAAPRKARCTSSGCATDFPPMSVITSPDCNSGNCLSLRDSTRTPLSVPK